MKHFNEAIEIFLDHINYYKKLCENAHQKIYSDTEAFFRNLNPFIYRHHGGVTGYQRAEKIINIMEIKIKNGDVFTTKELIKVAINYADKGTNLSRYIKKSIRECAGFSEKHVDILIPYYQDAKKRHTYDRYEGSTIKYPSESESRLGIEELIDRLIQNGSYKGLIRIGIDKYSIQNVVKQDLEQESDYGQKLLKFLNSKLSEIELEVIESRKNFSNV